MSLKGVCSRVELAALLDLSEQRVGVLTKTGVLTRGPTGYNIRSAVRSYLAFLRSKTGSLTDERARLTKSQADMAELKLRERTSELVRRDAVSKAVFANNRAIRDQFQNLPSRTAGLVAAESNQHKCFEILANEVRQILEDLST